MTRPILMQWDGEALYPAGQYWAIEADRQYVIGERYSIAPVTERSMASHRHYFAAIHEAWETLPDHKYAEYPTTEHLRKKMLIKAGYCTAINIACASKAEAVRAAMSLRGYDDYAIAIPRERVVTVYRAASQSVRAMGKQQFQASKDAVLDLLEDELEVPRGTLKERGDP